MAKEKNLEGLGGWLFLVGLNVVFIPFGIIAQTFQDYSPVFSDGTWELLTTPGTEAYNPLWKPIILGEIGMSVGYALAWIFTAFLFFSKKKVFPNWFIGATLAVFVKILLDMFLTTLVQPDEPIFDTETVQIIVRYAIVALIWISYIRISKRVKATFTR